MPFIKKIFIAIFLLIAILVSSFIYIKWTEETCYKYKLSFIVGNHTSQETKLISLIRDFISDEMYIDSVCTFHDQNIPIHFSYLVDTTIIKVSDSILLYDYITEDSLKKSKVPNFPKKQLLDLSKYPNSNNLIEFNEFSNFILELKYKINYSDILIFSTTSTDSLNYYIEKIRFPIYTNIDSLIKQKNEIIKNNVKQKIESNILIIYNPIFKYEKGIENSDGGQSEQSPPNKEIIENVDDKMKISNSANKMDLEVSQKDLDVMEEISEYETIIERLNKIKNMDAIDNINIEDYKDFLEAARKEKFLNPITKDGIDRLKLKYLKQ